MIINLIKLVLFFLVSITVIVAGAGILFPRSRPIPISPPSDLAVSALGVQIRYRVHQGEAPVIVFLHGFGGSLKEWQKLMPLLPHRHSIALDMVGFGGSDRPSLNYSLDAQRLHLLAFLDKLNIEKVVLVGRSMGASVAAWTAAKSPERVVGLILIAPSAYPGSLTYPWPLNWIYRPGMINTMSMLVVDNPLFELFFPNSLARQGISVTRSYNQNFSEALGGITQPTLLVWSNADKRVPFKFHQAYKKRIQNSTLLELPPSVGHYITGSYLESTALFISKFMNELAIK